ncbi:E7 [Equus caballus papillomavirus 5]|uniref:E7 n=1 Tax=Equus caballus papillomavirus 5 TaxID=1235429 RepID=K9M934_9PAPI|nr:E7 [Equus caballus papillomavirus 5]AFS89115.1 E7 [Equus caballus papillomavirus 5]
MRVSDSLKAQFLLYNEEVSSDEEDNRPPRGDAYRVHSTCVYCRTGVRLVVWCTRPMIHQLSVLLTQDLCLICPACAAVRGYNGS